MFQAQLQQFVLSNPALVTRKAVGDDMYVLKYTKKVFFNNLWNKFLEECRGAIVDSSFNLITYPFTKIYNYGIDKQSLELLDDTPVMVLDKINGFMVAVTWYNDDILISTTGSISSPYVSMARDTIGLMISKYAAICKEYPESTFIFECVHQNDPHIVPETPGMYLLGTREKQWLSNISVRRLSRMAEDFGCFSPKEMNMTLGELKQLTKLCQTEGYVFYTADGQSGKLKSPYYLFNKFVARKTPTKLIDLLETGNYRSFVDEEYYPLCETLKEHLAEFTLLDEQNRLRFIQDTLFASAC